MRTTLDLLMPRLVNHLKAEVPPNALVVVPHCGQWDVEKRELLKVLTCVINAIEHTIAPGTSEATKQQVVSGVLAEADAALVAKYTAARPSARPALAEWNATMARLARVPPWAALVIYLFTNEAVHGQTHSLRTVVNRTLHVAADCTDPARHYLGRLRGLWAFVQSLADALHQASDDLSRVFAPQATAGAENGHLYGHVVTETVPPSLSDLERPHVWHAFTSMTLDRNVADTLRNVYRRAAAQPDGAGSQSHFFTATVPVQPLMLRKSSRRIRPLRQLPVISVFSAFPEEREVLLPPGVLFRVMARNDRVLEAKVPSADEVDWRIRLVGQVDAVNEFGAGWPSSGSTTEGNPGAKKSGVPKLRHPTGDGGPHGGWRRSTGDGTLSSDDGSDADASCMSE